VDFWNIRWREPPGEPSNVRRRNSTTPFRMTAIVRPACHYLVAVVSVFGEIDLQAITVHKHSHRDARIGESRLIGA